MELGRAGKNGQREGAVSVEASPPTGLHATELPSLEVG